MKTFDDLISVHSSLGIDSLEHFDKSRALDAGIEPAVVSNWKMVHEAYYGENLSSAKQQKARDKARALGLSLGLLAQIERAVKHISHATRRHSYRMKLLSAAAHVSRTCAALLALAKRIVPAKEKTPPREQATFGVPNMGMTTVTLTMPERIAADLKFAAYKDIDPAKPIGPQLLLSLIHI